jgi:hypothetical protein
MAQLVQLRNDTEGRAYYRRKLSQGKTSMEAMRSCDGGCPTSSTANSSPTPQPRTLSDRAESDRADPGGHSGTTLQSSVTDLTPDIGSSDKPLPGPAPVWLPLAKPVEKPPRAGGSRPPAPTSADAPSKAPRTQPLTT